MKIPVNVRTFPGSEEERLDLLAAVRRNCACKAVRVAPGSISLVEEPCTAHGLLTDSGRLKQLVFQRRWRRARRIATV